MHNLLSPSAEIVNRDHRGPHKETNKQANNFSGYTQIYICFIFPTETSELLLTSKLLLLKYFLASTQNTRTHIYWNK